MEGAGVYGHNGADDVAMDAVLLARAVPGRAVRVQWTHEDEMCWAPLGSAMLARLSAGLDAGGRIVSWRQDVWSNGFMGRPTMGGDPRLLALTHLAGGRPMPPAPDLQPANWMGASRNAVPGYDIPGLHVTRHRLLDMPIRTSSLRSLGAHLNVFAIESFMDELAAAAGADPVGFRLAHLTDPRARQVLTQAAGMAGWDARVRRDGTGYGVGVARYSGVAGYCAAVAEVEADTEIRVRRLWLAVDVGRVINPDGVINQVEGGAVQSASWTLREQVRFDRYQITSAGWDSYLILRFTDTPEVMVHVMDAPGEAEVGAGEVAQGPVAGGPGGDRDAGAVGLSAAAVRRGWAEGGQDGQVRQRPVRRTGPAPRRPLPRLRRPADAAPGGVRRRNGPGAGRAAHGRGGDEHHRPGARAGRARVRAGLRRAEPPGRGAVPASGR